MNKRKPLNSRPAVVQLPGGIRLNAVPFRIVGYSDQNGSPMLFELLPPGSDGQWMLFADEAALRGFREKKS